MACVLLTPACGTDSISIRCLGTCLLPCQRVAHCSETVDFCIGKQQQYLVMSLCPPSIRTIKHLGHDYRFVRVWIPMAKAQEASHGGGLTREICIAFKNAAHVPRTVCRRFGFRALHQCKRTALLQSVPAVSDWTREGGHFGSHLASARAKQVVLDSCSLTKRHRLNNFCLWSFERLTLPFSRSGSYVVLSGSSSKRRRLHPFPGLHRPQTKSLGSARVFVTRARVNCRSVMVVLGLATSEECGSSPAWHPVSCMRLRQAPVGLTSSGPRVVDGRTLTTNTEAVRHVLEPSQPPRLNSPHSSVAAV